MNYLNFVIITDTPGKLATFLASRNIITQQTDQDTQQTYYVGVLPGMEWVKVPNPIVTGGTGTELDPYVYDTRACFLVKFAHESMDDQDDSATNSPGTDDYANVFDWTRFGRWVKGNSTLVDAPATYTINGEWAGQAYKINNQLVWLVRDRPERFGVWQ
jgi:hypothetical protein